MVRPSYITHKPSKLNTPQGKNTDSFRAQEVIWVWSEIYDTYHNFIVVRKDLKGQIMECIDEQYISTLKYSFTIYANVSPLQLMIHL